MKNNYALRNGLVLIGSVLLICLLISTKAFSQATIKVPFNPRTSQQATGDYKGKKTYSLQGDFTMIGNANAFLNPYSDGGNNSGSMKFSKLAGDPTSIVNSSSANFKLPAGVDASCTRVIYAGLYWAGRGDDDSGDVLSKSGNAGNGLNKKRVKFKAPGMASYVDLVAENIHYGGSDVSGMYTGYYDVTDYVRTAGIGNYAVGNIATFEGTGSNVGYYAGWGMVVIYENTALKWRDITVFDGFAQIKAQTIGTQSFGQLDVSGFLAAQKGAVNIKMGMMAGEGDRSISGDYFQIKKLNTSSWQTLSHGGNATDNFFNSSVYTGSNTRVPTNLNNYGIDVSMFDLPNTGNSLIANSQTSTSFRFGTTQDTYSIFNITFAVDAYVPEVEALNSSTNGIINQGQVSPGQDLEFELDIFNKGTEAIQNGKIEVQVPPYLHYVSAEPVSGGGTVSWSHPFSTDPVSTPGGKIVWDIGSIPLGADPQSIVAKLKYKLRVTNSCVLLTTSAADCGLSVKLNGKVSGQGVNSSNNIDASFITGYEQGACEGNPIRDSFSMTIKLDNAFLASCPDRTADGAKQFKVFCSIANNVIPRNDIITNYPAGTKFYSQVPGTSSYPASLIAGNFPVDPNGNPIKYYAVIEGMQEGCYLKLETLLEIVNTQPIVKDIEFCAGSPLPLDVQLSAAGAASGHQLYYFETSSSPVPLTAAPAPVLPGSYTYYVAEGITRNGITCFGSKVPFKVDVFASPVISQDLEDFYVCLDGNKVISLITDASQIVWQYFDQASSSWIELISSSFQNQLVPSGQDLRINEASSDLDGLRIRAKASSAGECVIYSKEVIIEVRNCKIPTNPMIPTKFSRSQ